MQFHIKCSTFVRLASICKFFEPTTDQDLKAEINTVRLENRNGCALAIATNHKIIAIEFLGNVPMENNGVAHVVLDPVLVNQCMAESFFDGILTINTIPEIATGMAQTSSGWNYPGNACHWFDETILDEWRTWAPSGNEVPTKSSGIMMWNLHHVQALLEASPSGKIVFPEHIDALKPVVIRDRLDPNWVGMFIPKPHGEIQREPAVLPEWCK